MARPAGSANLIPDKATREGYLKRLRQSADLGDSQAQVGLLLLAEVRQALRQLEHGDGRPSPQD